MGTIVGKNTLLRVTVIALAVAASNCIILPLPQESVVTGEIKTPVLQSLVGHTNHQVVTRLGEPAYVFAWPDLSESYYVYEGEKGFRMGWLSIITSATPGSYTETTINRDKLCYFLVFDADHRMVRFDVQQGDETYCPGYFLTAQERSDIDEISEIEHLEARAKQGDTAAAYALYKQLAGERKTIANAWRWLCKEANESHGEAQAEVALWHRLSIWKYSTSGELQWLSDEVGIQPDNRFAYMWYTLAASNGESNALWIRENVVEDMTPEEIVQAEQMVRDWKPGDCPSAEHRLGMPGCRSPDSRFGLVTVLC